MPQPVDPSISSETSERRIYTVARLLTGLRRLLADRVGHLWIVGEVSNLHRAPSGHCYFSLKDDVGQVRAVMFRASAQRVRFDLEEGLEVLVYAEVSVYEARGDLQLIVREVEPRGQGALQLAFEQLRARLESEGLFDEARKLPVPDHPRALAVVTSPTSAALRDVIHVTGKRWPGVPLYILPTRVQGAGAEREIASAIDAIAEITGLPPRRVAEGASPENGSGAPALEVELDVVLLIRGGGSLEDLMCFNSEVVARAIASCPLPVVTGVGHEVDLTIADLVADLRAATPSAAAVAVLPDRRALGAQLGRDWSRLRVAIGSRIRHKRGDWQREHEALRVLAPSAKLAAQRTRLGAAIRALASAARAAHQRQRARLSERVARLDSLSPLAVLARGYALVRRTADREIIRQSDQLSQGERLSIRVAEAQIEAVVESVEPVASD